MSAAVVSRRSGKFKETQEVDLAYSVQGLGRFRCNIFQQRGFAVGLVLRVIPMQSGRRRAGAAAGHQTIAESDRGLVLVTGTTGGGKSTTLAAIDHINKVRSARDDRGSDRVPAPRQQVDGQPARVTVDTRSFAQARRARRAGPRRHPGRRMRDFETIETACRGRDEPPRASTLHTLDARPRHQPHHRRVPAAPAET